MLVFSRRADIFPVVENRREVKSRMDPDKNGGKAMTVNPDIPYDLVDGASGEIGAVRKEVEEQFRIAGDLSAPLADRLEAFGDIMDSEIGDTNMARARNIEREVGLRQLYLKFEGGNPTGTQKDRIAFAQAQDALRRNFDTITLATCGNYGVAVALAASMAGLKCNVFIPATYHTKRIKEITDLGARIMRVEGDYENAVSVSSEWAHTNEWYDANPGGDNTPLQLSAYGEIAHEIYDELHDAPALVAVPVSNGTTLAGIYKGFLSLYRRGKTSRMPRLVAGSSFGKNPIVSAFLKGLDTCDDLAPERLKETPVNEPLINWHSLDGDYALTAIRQTHGWAANVSDKAMLQFTRILRDKEGMHVLPASMAGLIALLEKHQKEPLSRDRYVVVLTGKKT
jgi:threonine synthase